HGLLRPSFVPPRPIQELRDLTRYRVKLTGELNRIHGRIEKILEDANVKLGSVASDILGLLASIRSFLRLRPFVPSINRGLATSTSCPQPTMTSRTQAECVPTSKITRAAANAWKNAATSSRVVRNCPSPSVSPSSPKMQ